MQIFAPKYYQKFRCTAAACTHSCCVGWEIDVDEATLARYDALEGELGDEIRAGITRLEEGACFALDARERCPNLREDGLCRIIAALGEGYLCDICREHPRFYHTVGGRAECGVGASCEAAAALILGSDAYDEFVPVDTCEAQAADADAECGVLAFRGALFEVLGDRSLPVAERFARIGLICGGALPCAAHVRDVLGEMEYLDGAHRTLLLDYEEAPDRAGVEAECERFFAYLLYRHASKAQDGAELARAVGLATVVERLFAMLISRHAMPPVRAAVLLSEELEYSEENTDTLLRLTEI